MSQPSHRGTDWKKRLAEYRESDVLKSSWQLGSSIVLFFALWTSMYLSLSYSYWLTLLLSIPTAGVLLRLFVLQHDCGHGSFFKSQRLNNALGFALGTLVLTPYGTWRRYHALHHATNGNLDRRGHGDVHTITVAEYMKLSGIRKLRYRLLRNPVILFGVAPLIHFAVLQRLTLGVPPTWRKERVGIHLTNAVILAATAAGIWLIGLRQLLMIHLPVLYIASAAGVWLFYVQHNFESAYWERSDDWDYETAAITGSSYYCLPQPLQWLTANIGFHHIHHLDSRIPNYRLQECFEEITDLQQVPRLTLWQSLSCMSLKLFDEDSGKMVGFRDCRPADNPGQH